MVLLESLQKAIVFCVEDNKATQSDSLVKENIGRDERSLRRTSPSCQPWTILGPVARAFKESAAVVNNTVLQIRDGLTEEQRAAKKRKEERRQILELRLKNAETMESYKDAARELDLLEENETWKYDQNSGDFDAPLIVARLKQLDDARVNCDIKSMLYLVRTALARDLGGMGNIGLYKRRIGTKYLIERYIDSTVDTIRALVELSRHALPDSLETKDILEQVIYARQAFGRSALLLSGGATFGMNHVGVLKALFESNLLPRIISGASAGSIVCSVLCTRTDEEIPKVLEKFPYGDLAVFEEEGNEDGVLERVRRLFTTGSWIDIRHLRRHNPVTGQITSWNPTPQHWIDGSVDSDLPMNRLAEMFNVNHFIVSQVNPHVVPFLAKDQEAIARDVQSDEGSGPGWVYTLTNLAKDEALHRMQMLSELGICPNLMTKCRSILSQRYSGDITILPDIEYKDFPRILKNPTPDFILQACLRGERATWPKLSMIRNHCAVELELDHAVQKLRERVVFSPSKTDLRRISSSINTNRSTRKRMEGSFRSMETTAEDSGDDDEKKDGRTRPPFRTVSTNWSIPRRYPPPPTSFRSEHTTPMHTPYTGSESQPYKFPIPKHTFTPSQQLPDVLSAEETTQSHLSSDADVDSITDESTLESDIPFTRPKLDMYINSSRHGGAVDLFSASQPVTSNTDRLMATTPTRANVEQFNFSPTSIVPDIAADRRKF
ncbi:hypothetical protein B7494_g490 [Chlorociboria aeruginascens]|nr:hypothetical protein B7494_g490 [Chlorociboria aeruginascens]